MTRCRRTAWPPALPAPCILIALRNLMRRPSFQPYVFFIACHGESSQPLVNKLYNLSETQYNPMYELDQEGTFR